MHADGEVQYALARRAALSSLRMERGADQQSASLAEHVRRVEADFVAPEGVDAAEAERLKDVAKRRATFDPSPPRRPGRVRRSGSSDLRRIAKSVLEGWSPTLRLGMRSESESAILEDNVFGGLEFH